MTRGERRRDGEQFACKFGGVNGGWLYKSGM